ncbi:hypothetical protein [Mangrovibacterium sp.]|uniref:hypothetical protein n=1 Tax=Mangrovibacterium sp. TaxID=1961364 RepID=UPI00356ACF09
MQINRSNYESFFIDYIDGTLPDDLVNDFLDFLGNNPDLAEELKAVSSMKLPDESVIFDQKQQLYRTKSNTLEDFDFHAVAFLEGDLNEQQKQAFLNDVAADNAKLQSLQVLQKMRLHPEPQFIFPNKGKLLRHKRKPVYLWAIRAAAVLLITFTVWVIIPHREVSVPHLRLAEEYRPEIFEEEIQAAEQEITQQENNSNNLAAASYSGELKPEKVDEAAQNQATVQNQEAEIYELPKIQQREQAPEKIRPLQARIEMKHELIAAIHFPGKNEPQHTDNILSFDEFLAHKLIDAPKGESFTFNNLANASLKVAQNIASDRLDVARNEEGKIQKIKFESRLIAFSIPFKKNR